MEVLKGDVAMFPSVYFFRTIVQVCLCDVCQASGQELSTALMEMNEIYL